MSDDSFDKAKKGLSVVRDLVEIAGESPDAVAAGAELGKTALTVTKAINVALMPLTAINAAFDRTKEYFTTVFPGEIAEKAAGIPEEHVVLPKALIAGPAMTALGFSHDEPPLKDMYLSLISNSMDGRAADHVHPAFVDIIRQLTSTEAYLLTILLRNDDGRPVVEVRVTQTARNYKVIRRHLLPRLAGERRVGAPTEAMVENFVRLGLVWVDYDKEVAGDAYDWMEDRPLVQQLRAELEGEALETDERSMAVVFARGCLARTQFGAQFAASVGIGPTPSERPAPS